MMIKRWKVYSVFAIVACAWFAYQIIVHQTRWRELERYVPWGSLTGLLGHIETKRPCARFVSPFSLRCDADAKGFSSVVSLRREARLSRDHAESLGRIPSVWLVPYARESPGLWLFLDRSTGTLFVMIEGPPLPSSGAPSYLLLDFFLDGHVQLADGVAAFLARLDDMGRHDDPPSPPVWRADRADRGASSRYGEGGEARSQ